MSECMDKIVMYGLNIHGFFISQCLRYNTMGIVISLIESLLVL